jgi:hypothetical protein
MKSAIRILITVIFITPVSLTYALDCQPNPDHHPDALIEIKDAKDVSYLTCQYPNGWQPNQVTYSLKKDYPAADVIKEISEALSHKGWQALKKDMLKSNTASTMWNWERQTVPLKNGEQMLLLTWSGEWRNPKGDFVNYILSYTRPLAGNTDITNEPSPGV